MYALSWFSSCDRSVCKRLLAEVPLARVGHATTSGMDHSTFFTTLSEDAAAEPELSKGRLGIAYFLYMKQVFKSSFTASKLKGLKA